jgi:DNA primase
MSFRLLGQLTPDQIRLINRHKKKHYSAFDGDAAGLRASVRGMI